MKKYFLIGILIALLGISAVGQDPPLDGNISVDPLTYNINVFVNTSQVPGWDNKSKWVIVTVENSASKAVRKVGIDRIEPKINNSQFSIIPTIESKTAISNASRIMINFGSKVIAVSPPLPAENKPPDVNLIAAESTKQKADFYLNGSYSPGFGDSAPQYSLDSSVALMFDLSRTANSKYGQLGFVGSAKTDKRKKVDPDSYRAFLAYQNVVSSKPSRPLQGVQFTWLGAGFEFDRKGKNTNFITAPYLDFPVRIYPRTFKRLDQPLVVLTPSIGFETGHNFRNAVTPDNGRAVFRTFLGADLLFRFNPKIPVVKGITFTGAYNLRNSLIREIYTLTRKENNQDVDVPFLNKKPRSYVKSELAFNLSDYFAASIKYEHGMLPPIFRKVENKLTFGFTLAAKQTGFGIPSTIRNK